MFNDIITWTTALPIPFWGWILIAGIALYMAMSMAVSLFLAVLVAPWQREMQKVEAENVKQAKKDGDYYV